MIDIPSFFERYPYITNLNMSIEIKRSIKPVDYNDAINLIEKRLEKVINNKENELNMVFRT